MSNIFKPKRSSTASSVPTTSDLTDGELAVNISDKKIYLRSGSNIVEVANSSGDLVDDTTPQLGGTLDTNGNLIQFADGDDSIATLNRLQFGDSQDLQIYHDPDAGSVVQHDGGGSLYVRANGTSEDLILRAGRNIRIQPSGSENGIKVNANGAVRIYYDNVNKFETTGAGVTVFGTTQTQQLNVSGISTFNNTVHLPANVQLRFDSSNLIDNDSLRIYDDGSNSRFQSDHNIFFGTDDAWAVLNESGNEYKINVAFGAVELYYDGTKRFETTGAGVTITGVCTATSFVGNLTGNVTGIADTALKVHVGHESADTTCRPLFTTTDSGYLQPKTNSNFTFNSSNGTLTATSFAGDGSNITGISTTNITDYGVGLGGGGISSVSEDTTPQLGGTLDTNGNLIQFGDSGSATDDRLQFGASQDLEIYHDGSNSFISDQGTGLLSIDSSFIRLRNAAGTSVLATFSPGTDSQGGSQLYYDGTKRFETTSSGAVVTGILTATNFFGTTQGQVSYITATETLTNKTLRNPTFEGGANSPEFLETRYANATQQDFVQLYTGGSSGSYFTQGEYQKIATITPGGNSQNYTFIIEITATSGSNYQIVRFTGALRSNTLPDLSFTVNYSEEHNGTRFIEPKLWTKETTTAGFILAFEYVHNHNLYGGVNVDATIIPRSNAQRANVTFNTTQDSEQSSIDTGFTENDPTLTLSTVNGVPVFGTEFKIEGSTDNDFETTITSVDATADRTITFPDSTGTVLTTADEGSGNGLDADTVDGQEGSYYLNYNNFTNTPTIPTNNNELTNGAGYITGLSFNGLSSKTSGTGEYSTNSHLVSGRGSGGVALTINDGYGNANVTFNHKSGTPEQDGKAGRIEVNTDSTSGAATMSFELGDATASTAAAITQILLLSTGSSIWSSSAGLTFNNTPAFNGGVSGSTAPFTVDSTTKVTNLNADLLDGQEGSSFLRSDAADQKTSGTLRFNDNVILSLGSGDDAEFFVNGSHCYLDLNSGIGNFYIRDGTTTRYTFDDNGDFTATGSVTATSFSGSGSDLTDIGIPQNSQTSAYTLVASDNGKHVNITTGGVTVPSSVFSAGDVVTIYNDSGSNQTITQGSSATLRLAGTSDTGNRTLAQYGLATILCVGGDGSDSEFVISGAGLS